MEKRVYDVECPRCGNKGRPYPIVWDGDAYECKKCGRIFTILGT